MPQHWLVDPDLKTYGHVVVDEAQNLTPMALRMVVRRARRQSLTVLGDIAQRTEESGLGGWGEVLGDAGVTRDRVSSSVSYRVPEDFLRIAATCTRGRRAAGRPGCAVGGRGGRRCGHRAAVAELAERMRRTSAASG